MRHVWFVITAAVSATMSRCFSRIFHVACLRRFRETSHPMAHWLAVTTLILLEASCIAVTLLGGGRVAYAELSAEARATLSRGNTHVSPLDYPRGSHHFTGGISYRIINRDIESVSRAVRDPDILQIILPNVRETKLLEVTKAGRAIVRVTHAIGPFLGSYRVAIAFTEHGRFCRFHSVFNEEDDAVTEAWGYARLTEVDATHTLVTWAILYELSSSVVRGLFKERIRTKALEVPTRLAWHLGG